MTLFGKVIFVAACLLGLVGVCLFYSGISRMKIAGVPPFNDGLYTAVWTIPSPSNGILKWCDLVYGRLVVIGSLILLPGFAGWIASKNQLYAASFFLVITWAIICGFFGIWTWIFSLFI